MAAGDIKKINVNSVTIDTVRFTETKGGAAINHPLSYVGISYESGDTAENEPILSIDFTGARPIYAPDTTRVELVTNPEPNTVKDEFGVALPANTVIWYQTPTIPAPTITTVVTATYISGLGASGTSPTDPNALASVTGPIRVKFTSTEQ